MLASPLRRYLLDLLQDPNGLGDECLGSLGQFQGAGGSCVPLWIFMVFHLDHMAKSFRMLGVLMQSRDFNLSTPNRPGKPFEEEPSRSHQLSKSSTNTLPARTVSKPSPS